MELMGQQIMLELESTVKCIFWAAPKQLFETAHFFQTATHKVCLQVNAYAIILISGLD